MDSCPARRRNPFHQLTLFAAVTLACCVPASQAEITLQILDNTGTPVPDAVLWPVGQTGTDARGSSARTSVDQHDKRFVPFVSVVAPGSLVDFPNSDDIRHHVFSFSEGNSFERKLYRANDADPVRFDTPGIVALGCNIHDNMEAYVLVRDPKGTVISDARGIANLAVDADAALELWYPELDAPLPLQPSSLPRDKQGRFRVELPLRWERPQQPRSDGELEQLLKRFSTDAE